LGYRQPVAQNPVDKITRLLDDDAPEKRIAAAIVLGELKAKGPKVVQGLLRALDTDSPPLQRHALDALAQIGAKKAAASIAPLVGARDRAVRAAAVAALLSIGESVVPLVEARLPEATPDERRGLDAVLAKLGGREAFGALLSGLEQADEQEANAAAVAMRQQVKDADAKQRAAQHKQLERFLAQQAKKAAAVRSVPAVKAAIKMLGFLEHDRAVPLLLDYTRDKHPAPVRQEALIALRFCSQGKKADAKLVNALVKAAESDDRTLAQTALITLSGIAFPPRTAQRLEALVSHRDIDRAAVAIDMLAHREETEAAELLVDVLLSEERRRAELAARGLSERADATPALVKALCRGVDVERARRIGKVLRPHVSAVTAPQAKKLLEAGLAQLQKGEGGWQVLLEVAREAAPKKTATGLRALAQKLKRAKKSELARVALRALCRGDDATDDDRYALASLAIADSRKDTGRAAREDDEAIALLSKLALGGFDVVGALKKDRSVGLEELYYLGFHFTELRFPFGAELLQHVVDKGGRKKIAKAAKNKLELSGG
jgi:HEAT repeat protein